VYPALLALGNVGVGTTLYAAGVVWPALLLWVGGVLVAAGAVSSAAPETRCRSAFPARCLRRLLGSRPC